MARWTGLLLCIPIASATWAAVNLRCDPDPAAEKALTDLSERSRDMKYSERLAYQRQTLERLLRQYPGDLGVERRYVDFFKYQVPNELAALQQRYRERADRNPKDPTAQYVAGITLQGYHTPEAIRLMERAKEIDPGFGWPYMSLTNTYSGGKFANKEKAEENIAGYFRACPDSTYGFALSLLGRYGSAEVQAATARRLRERLATETDPKKLRVFAEIWSLEFRTRPVAEHPALRKQVTEDLKWLQSRNSKPDAEWLDFLKNGYKQSSVPKEETTAIEDRILKEFPASNDALAVLRDRWKKDHPDPKPDDSAETWDKYLHAQIANTEEWIGRFPKADYLKDSLFYQVTSVYPVPLERATKLGEEVLKSQEERWGPSPHTPMALARFYLKHNLSPERALELARTADSLMRKDLARELEHDDRTDKQLEDMRKYQASQEQNSQNLLLQAYRVLHRVDDARALKPKLEGPVPKDAPQALAHWANLALEAEIEGRKTDALAYYQAALNARAQPPNKRFGRVEDPLLDDARKLFLASGGSETAWNIWSGRPSVKSVTTTDAHWERPGKDMQPFELADLAGKTWNLKGLEGRTVLITVWASW